MIKHALSTALSTVLLLAGNSAGAALLEVDQRTYGMDCAPCKYGVERSLGRLDGVESVQVSLEQESAQVQLAPHNRITLAEIRNIVERNGFTPDEAQIRVSGQLERTNGAWYLAITDADRFELDLQHLNETEREQLEAVVGERIEARGRVAAGDPAALPLEVAAITTE